MKNDKETKQEIKSTPIDVKAQFDKKANEVFDSTNKTLGFARDMLWTNWLIQTENNKELLKTNPFDDFVKMLEWYANQAKESYAIHLKELGIDLSADDKKILKKTDLDKSKPAQSIVAKQIKQLKLE